jgi:hypothetical protein
VTGNSLDTKPNIKMQHPMASQGYNDALLQQWFPANEHEAQRTSFTETDIRDIATLLGRSPKKEWSLIPRIYIVLRRIGHLEAIEGFTSQNITDFWFPFTQRSLPESLGSNSARLDFLAAQEIVCNTRALNLERTDAGHGHFRDPDEIPLRKIGELGKGGSGFVHRVISTITHREYALKLIPRGRTFRKDKQVLQDFEKELSNLKRLSQAHHHIVDLIGSRISKFEQFVHMALTIRRHPDVSRCRLQPRRNVRASSA